MINEKKLAELRKSYHDHWLELEEDGYPSDVDFKTAKDMLDTLEKLWKVARAGSNIEDMLQVPQLLGSSGQAIAQKAIDDFREALSALKS